jgi:hypothetical protein
MAASEEPSEPKVGTRVHVMSANGKKDLGYDTYMGRVPMSEIPDETPDVVAFDHTPIPLRADEEAALNALVEGLYGIDATMPKILLDSGETIYGFQCWWIEVPTDEQATAH